MLVRVGSLAAWPQLMAQLLTVLERHAEAAAAGAVSGGAVYELEGAFTCLDILSEDHALELDAEEAGRPVNALLPLLLRYFHARDVRLRLSTLLVLQRFLVSMPQFLAVHLSRFLDGYLFLAQDSDARVRERVIAALLTLLDTRASALDAVLPRVFEFVMWTQTPRDNAAPEEDDDDAYKALLDSFEFYRLLARYPERCAALLRPQLARVFNVLLARMVYTDTDLAALGGEGAEDDAEVAEQEHEVRPVFTKTRGDDEREDDAAYDNLEHWNVRKAAAEALDILARVLDEPFLPELLPLVERGMQHAQWRVREAALLALGCVGAGKSGEMKPHLPTLVPYLLALVHDPHPLIRAVACWTVARYSRWILRQEDKERFAHALVRALLTRMLDKSKKVQKAATSALAYTTQEAGYDALPYAEALLTQYARALETFQRRNLYVLLDALATLANALGSTLAEDRFTRIFLPPLLRVWVRAPRRPPLRRLRCPRTRRATTTRPCFRCSTASTRSRTRSATSSHRSLRRSSGAA